VALIAVGDRGENSIVVVPGANALVTPGDVEASLESMPDARMVLLQLELPLPTVQAAARTAHARGLQVMLDPAPAQPLPRELLQDVDILLPNQGEAGLLAGLPVVSLVEARDAARRLLTHGPRTVLIKLGADGVLIVDAAGDRHIAGRRVVAVDTTAAGDCLAGALAVALIEGQPLDRAVAFANAAAALSTTRPGAQDSMPSRAEVDAFSAALA
jgi:ribokinase